MFRWRQWQDKEIISFHYYYLWFVIHEWMKSLEERRNMKWNFLRFFCFASEFHNEITENSQTKTTRKKIYIPLEQRTTNNETITKPENIFSMIIISKRYHRKKYKRIAHDPWQTITSWVTPTGNNNNNINNNNNNNIWMKHQ